MNRRSTTRAVPTSVPLCTLKGVHSAQRFRGRQLPLWHRGAQRLTEVTEVVAGGNQ